MAEEKDAGEEIAEALAVEPLLQFRKGVIEEYRKRLPILGQFSADQYARPEGAMGDVFVPHWKEGMPFTYLQRKHVKPLLRAYWVHEIQQAARELRTPNIGGLLAYFEWLMAQLEGRAAEWYLRTGVAGLTPPPQTGFWSRLLRRRR